jgi:predicted ATPase
LHWADPSTLELIQLLDEQGATARLLLLYTARPEFRAQWPSRAHHTQITLNRLSSRNVHTMVGQVAARHALSDETVTAVVERSGGVPLFVEELTRAAGGERWEVERERDSDDAARLTNGPSRSARACEGGRTIGCGYRA